MQNIFVEFLPPWIETGLQPAFYDKESGTVLQQVARMYAKVNWLIKVFNDFSKDTTNFVNDFVASTTETVNDYIARFVALKDFVDNYFDNLDVQEEIDNKLDEMVEDGTLQDIIEYYFKNRFHKGSDLGMSETSTEAVALSNFTILKNALEAGYNVIIDGDYPIKNTDVTNSISLTTDVILQGTSEGSLYNYDNNSLYLIEENENDISIEKLALTNAYNSEIQVIQNSASNTVPTKYGNIKLTNSTLTGNIRLIYITNTEANLNTNNWGLQNIDIINNSIENTTVATIHITDTPHGIINILSNNIHNFAPVFFRSSHSTQEVDTNVEKLKCVNADGNIVHNDDNWFINAGTYGAFIVTKVYEVNVTNNKISGIKSNSASVAIYASYLSGIFVKFENNECVNNINFASSTSNWLMKAKDGNGYKSFINNTFLLDQEWLEAINAGFTTAYTLEQLATNTTVNIYHNDHHSKRWIIEGNKIKVGRIDMYSAAKNIDEFIFKNNIVDCVSFNGYLFRLYNGVTKQCEICDNDFYISDGSTITDATLLSSSYGVTTDADIKINGNQIICNQKCLTFFSTEASKAKTIEVTGNSYNNSYSGTPQSTRRTFNLGLESTNITMDNHITYGNNQITMLNVIGNNEVDITYHINTLGLGNSDTTGEQLTFANVCTKSYVVELDYLKNNAKVSEYYILHFSNSDNKNYLTFIDNSDSTSKTVELALQPSSTNYYVKDGEGGTSHLQLLLPTTGVVRLRLAGALLTDNHYCKIRIHNI